MVNNTFLDLKGIIPPMVTPLTADKKLDEEGLKRLVEHLISGGVHGIFLLGSSGEAPSLSCSLRKELVTKACRYINRRVPVLVGITDTSFQNAIEMAHHSKASGADVVVVAPPYYFPITDTEMEEYLNNLLPELPLPFLLYNMPSCTKINLSVETIAKAKTSGALGIKDSSGDVDYFNGLIEAFGDTPDFAIITGTESFLYDTIKHGGHGAVAGGANFFPKLFVDLYNASLEDDVKTVEKLNHIVKYIYENVYSVGKDASRIIKGIKCALSAMGICKDYMALPFRRFDLKEREKIKYHISYISNLSQRTAPKIK